MRYGKLLAAVTATFALLLAGHVRAETPAPGAAGQDLDAYIDAQREEAGIVGLGAAILVDGKIVWTKGYGHADRAQGLPFTPDTVMNVGSISKTATGVALMRAVQEGRLSLDADVNDYLPFKVVNPRFPEARITLRQLATHTSSITDRWAVYRETYHFGGEPHPALGDFLRAYFVPGGTTYAAGNFLDVKPGTHREYSNIGAALAGYIVECATGESLSDYMRRTVFEPLGMRNTAWLLNDVEPSHHSTLYVGQFGLAVPIPRYTLTTYPDGGLRTSVADLSRMFAALLDDGSYDGVRILDAATTKEMLRYQYTSAAKPDNVELDEKNSGIFWQTKFNTKYMGHGGSDPGVSTEMLASPSKDVGVVLFSNTSLTGEESVAYVNILNALFQRAEAMKKN
jgi:CubicO group peptidase (beta-lactamase class C family)